MAQSTLDKWAAVADKGAAIMGFLDWYDYHQDELKQMSRYDQIYTFFSIDGRQLEKERRALLDKVQQEARDKI